MFDISRAVKAKIENLSKDNLEQAQQKCGMATLLLETATETKDNRLIADAVEEYLQAIEIYSKLAEPYFAIAYICWLTGNPEDSIKLLNKVLEIEPFNQKAAIMLRQITDEIKNKILSSTIKKHSDKSLNNLMKDNNRSTKSDVFSKLSEMFLNKPKNSSNKKKNDAKKVLVNKPVGNVPVSQIANTPVRQPGNVPVRPVVNAPAVKKSDDFLSLVQQTRKTMYGNEKK